MQSNLLSSVLNEMEVFKVLTKIGDSEFERLGRHIEALERNQYFLESDIDGIKKYEKMLGIKPQGTESLEDRKFKIHSMYNHKLPYTERSIKLLLDEILGINGYTYDFDKKKKVLKLGVELIRKSMFNTISNMLDEILPLDIVVIITLRYNQHSTLKKFTHGELKRFTYSQLRNEVLNG